MINKNFTSPFKPLALTLTLVALLIGTTAKAQLNKQLGDTLTKLMELRAQQLNMKGVSAAIVFPDNSVWEHTTGTAGTKPLNTDMLFEMGSNTKTFTMALILLLEEEGKLSLDDTVYKYLPPMKNITNGITIKQLLYHSTGLYNYTNHPDFGDELNNGDPNKIFNIDTMLKKYVDTKYSDPGLYWRYSNTNYILLGKIIEEVTKTPYHVALRNMLLVPNGLQHTYLAEYETHTEEKAEAWLATTNGGVIYDKTRYRNFLSAAWAAGGIISTAEDLAKWAKLLYSNKIFKNNETYKKMLTQLNINGQEYQFGLSTFFRMYKGNLYLGHGGTTLQHSEMEFAGKRNFSFVAVTNDQSKSNELEALKKSIYDLMEAQLPLALSTKEVEKRQFKAYPNPSNNIINIAVENPAEKHNVKVYDISGKLLKQIESSYTATIQLNKADFGTGIYIVSVENKQNNSVSHQRIVFK